MEQQDYLKRQIDQLGKVLGKILADLVGLKNQGQASEAIEITDQALKNQLDFDIDELINLPADKFIEKLTKNSKLSNEQIETLNDVFFELAEGIEQNGHSSKAITLLEKILSLYDYLDKTGTIYPFDRSLKIEKVKSLLTKLNNG
jgi:hypothetical protein